MVFELSPSGNGQWSGKTVHAFNGKNGAGPYAVVFDTVGNLYGTTSSGGNVGCNPPSGCGVVYELCPGMNRTWKETVLRSFYVKPKYPEGKLAFDTKGSLYGTTVGGVRAVGGGCGRVFKLTPTENGKWSYNVVHHLRGRPNDGSYPYSGVVFDAAGHLYGTTDQGGSGIWNVGCGTVYQITS
jgi:uncharacterized repeat protein (TIGR03803 family)